MKRDQKIDFKSLNDELDQILEDLEKPEIDVDKMIAKYARGVEIVKDLGKYLKESENKIKKVKDNFKK